MTKAKIGFEVDINDLANAKAYVARHGGSLNKLVASLFSSLGKEERAKAPVRDPAEAVLLEVSSGKISIMEAARKLELPDAGYVFERLAAAGLPLPRLPDEEVRRQLDDARDALRACLIDPLPEGKKRGRSAKKTPAQ
jgi:hypothetical protein